MSLEELQMRCYALRGEVLGSARTYVLMSGVNDVGSAPDNGLVLAERGVSKRHARIAVRGGQIRVQDLKSKNGTFVNGVSVTESELRVGDRVQLGPVVLSLDELDESDGLLAITLPAGQPDTGSETAGPDTPGPDTPGPDTPGPDTPGPDTSQLATSARGELDPRMALARVERFLCALPSRPDGQLAPALARLAEDLGAASCAFFELLDGESSSGDSRADPMILACHGSLDSMSMRGLGTAGGPGADEAGAGNSDVELTYREPLFGSGELPMLAAVYRLRGRPLGLAVWGHLPDPRGAELLLRVLVRVLAREWGHGARDTKDGHADRGWVAGQARLQFPASYVVGESPAMRGLYRQLAAVAHTDVPILILGETGVGKEGIARTVHGSSARAQGPFVAINCSAIPAQLLEAELFGIGKGVATGVDERKGKFQVAAGGTVFLDEIGDMSPGLQAKLLRALQEKEIDPVGAAPLPTDVRVIAATNTRLGEKMDAGLFRHDLYYRLAGCVLRVAPLRQRREDIPALVEHFLRAHAREASAAVRGLSVRALKRLIDRPWPGNVRELEHEIRRLVYLCGGSQHIVSTMLDGPDEGSYAPAGSAAGSAEPRASSSHAETLSNALAHSLDLEALEKQAIEEALTRTDGRRAAAARLLGISRDSLRRRMIRYGLVASAD